MAAGRHGGTREELMRGNFTLAWQGGGTQRDPSHSLETLEQGMEDDPGGIGQPSWWPFSERGTNLSLSFSQSNTFTYAHVPASGLILSLLFHSKLKEARE